MKEFNFNDLVYVKLTDFGINILRQNHEIFEQQNPLVPKREFEIQVDENGYTPFKLWDFMATFGPYIGTGNNNVPFEANILISEQNLNDYERGRNL